MNRSVRRLPACAAIASLAVVVPLATTTTATSPPDPDDDQDRVNESVEAFAGVMHDAGIDPEDEDEPIVADTMVDLEAISYDLDEFPAPECLEQAVLEEAAATPIDPDAYAASRSVEFSSGEGFPVWAAIAIVGDENDPIFDLTFRATLPETESCVEEVMNAALTDLGSESDEEVPDFHVDVSIRTDLGVGTESMLVSMTFGGTFEGESEEGYYVFAQAAVRDGVVGLATQSTEGDFEPDEDLVIDALGAMADALEP